MLLNVNEVKVDDYFKKYTTGSKLIGFIPVKDSNNALISYYSVACEHPIYKRVVPVFAIPPHRTQPVYVKATKKMVDKPLPEFVFDSEDSALNSKKKEVSSAMKKHFDENPFVLFFKGCDDGHKGMRFKNEQEAMEYLQMFDFFDEVIDEKDMQMHN
jgi:hypothetical protein